jgi:predicted DNA-binding transcriptional regulator YafY
MVKNITFVKAWCLLNLLAFVQPIGLNELASYFSTSKSEISKMVRHLALAGVPDFLPDRLLTFDENKLEKGLVYCSNDLKLFDYFKGKDRWRMWNPDLIATFFKQSQTDTRVLLKYRDETGKLTDREVENWSYYETSRGQYIDAYCNLRKATRTFRIKGMIAVQAQNQGKTLMLK